MSKAESPHMLRNVQPRGEGRDNQGRRRHTGMPRHAHTRAADTTPAPEERRHCALSEPSLNEHSARQPPLGTNSIREHGCYDGHRRLHYFHCARLASYTSRLQGYVNYQSELVTRDYCKICPKSTKFYSNFDLN